MVEVGTTFSSYYADGRFVFTVVAVGTIDGFEVAVAEMDDEYYGHVRKTFLVQEIQNILDRHK